jgi:hypothetical protein
MRELLLVGSAASVMVERADGSRGRPGLLVSFSSTLWSSWVQPHQGQLLHPGTGHAFLLQPQSRMISITWRICSRQYISQWEDTMLLGLGVKLENDMRPLVQSPW